MAVKLSELADDAVVYQEDRAVCSAAELRAEFADGEETDTQGWYLGELRTWNPDAEKMFDHYTESALEWADEATVSAVYAEFRQVQAQIQALLDGIGFRYYEPMDDVEIDVPVTKEADDE